MGQNVAVAQIESVTPSHFTWSIPGAPVQVRLPLHAVERLQGQLEKAGAIDCEQGLLWGNPRGRTTEILELTAFAGRVRPSAEQVKAAIAPTGASVPVGYYRIHHGNEIRLDEQEVAWARTVFPAPYQVLLLIQPKETGPANATFFFWQNGEMFGDFPFLEFPFERSQLERARPNRTK